MATDMALRMVGATLLLSLAVSGQAQTPANDTKIMLERWGCYGTCPVSVVYQGKAYVSSRGVHKGRVSQSDVQTLIQKFLDAKFFDMSDGNFVVDLPVRVLSVTHDGRHKELKEGCLCPPEPVALEDDVDKAAQSEKWVRGRVRMFFHWPWHRS
jgi:Domain of unknown function (DUF6438)